MWWEDAVDGEVTLLNVPCVRVKVKESDHNYSAAGLSSGMPDYDSKKMLLEKAVGEEET